MAKRAPKCDLTKEVLIDIRHKYETKLDDDAYLEDNDYDTLPEEEKFAACLKDAKDDFIKSMADSRKCSRPDLDGEFNNLYFSYYHKLGGTRACNMAAKIAADLTLEDL